MLQKLTVIALVGAVAAALTAGAAQPRSAPVHLATISITKATVVGNKATVGVKISGLSLQGAHWHLLWKKRGTKQDPKSYVAVTAFANNPTASNALRATTKALSAGEWVLRVVLVDKNHTPFKASQYPDAKLSAARIVTVGGGGYG
jgi:hypothetical protein